MPPAVADVQDAPLGPSRVIDEADPFPVPQPPQPPGDDSNAVVQQLTVERIVDVGLDRRGIDPNPLAFFQTPSLRPAHQVVVDRLPCPRLNLPQVLRQGGFADRRPIGQATEPLTALRIHQMKLQLAIAELMQLFDDGTTQHLLGRQTGGADTGIDPVREILYYQLQRLGIVVQDARDHLQFIGQLVIGPWWGKGALFFTLLTHLRTPEIVLSRFSLIVYTR